MGALLSGSHFAVQGLVAFECVCVCVRASIALTDRRVGGVARRKTKKGKERNDENKQKNDEQKEWRGTHTPPL